MRHAPQLLLRPAETADLPELASLHLRAREAAVPSMPALVHPPDDVRRFVLGWDLTRRETWLAEEGGRLVGYVVLERDWLDSLYVEPAQQQRGIGSALLALAQGLRPDGFGLWVFVSNAAARAFYAAHGLVELETTDGSANEERSPDVHLVWRP